MSQTIIIDKEEEEQIRQQQEEENSLQHKFQAENSSSIITTTALATNKVVYRLGRTDIWACKNCKIKADKHFMQIHDCSGKR
jgi:hypothetical protein